MHLLYVICICVIIHNIYLYSSTLQLLFSKIRQAFCYIVAAQYIFLTEFYPINGMNFIKVFTNFRIVIFF